MEAAVSDERPVSRLELLENARDKLLAAIEEAEPRELSRLVGELRATAKEIDDLAPKRGVSRLDELAARRRARLSDPTGAEGATG